MNILLILAHPDKNSFNHAISETAQNNLCWNGHSVIFHDLYAENFDPVLQAGEISKTGLTDDLVIRHCNDLISCDGIVIVHPNWWGQPPAILKGWVDRVLRQGIAYEFLEGDTGEGIPKGLLKAKSAIVFTTSNTSVEREKNVFFDPLETLWKNCIFDLCGIKNVTRRNFEIVITSTKLQRQEWLKEVANIITFNFPEIVISKFIQTH